MTSKLSLLTGILALEPTLGSAALRILDGEEPVVSGTAAPENSKDETATEDEDEP